MIKHHKQLIVATAGALLPFAAVTLLVIAFRNEIGHKHYPSKEWDRITSIISSVGWICLALMPISFIPYAWNVCRHLRLFRRALTLLTCLAAASVITPLFLAYYALVYSMAGGVK